MNCFWRDSRISIRRALPIAAFVGVIAALTLVVGEPAQAQTYTIVHSFAGRSTDASYPNGELVQDAAGNFYGTSVRGGASVGGTVFEMDPNGDVTILYSFGDNSNGEEPEAGLLPDGQGNFYGTTQETAFRLDANNTSKRCMSSANETTGAERRPGWLRSRETSTSSLAAEAARAVQAAAGASLR